jgi:hopanoid biosynthesis associated RND transporter like protein HpnN
MDTREMKHTLATKEQRLFRLLAHCTVTAPWTIILCSLLLAAMAVYSTVHHLEFVTGRNDLISSNKRYIQLDDEYSQEFMGIDQVVVVVDPRSVQQGKDFVTKLAETLSADTKHVAEVFYQIDTSTLEGKKLLYLSPEDLRSLRENLDEYHTLVHDLTTSPGINPLFRAINQQVSSGMVSHLVGNLFGLDSATEAEDKKEAAAKPVQIGFLKSLLQELNLTLSTNEHDYRSPWADFFGGTEEWSDNGYLVSDNRRFVFLMVEPKKDAEGGFSDLQESITAIRQAIAALRQQSQFQGLTAGVTGTRALDSDEMASVQADGGVATIACFLGVTLLYFLFYRKMRHPLLIASALTIGLAWTMGFIALTVGHLTVITMFVGPMLLGLADDFGVHLMTRYEEERSRGQTPQAALNEVFEHTVPGITAGAVTTSLAFFAVMLADFRGMQELGLITGAGLLLSLIAMVTLLPAMIVVLESYRPWQATVGGRAFLTGTFAGLGSVLVRQRQLLLVLCGGITLCSLIALPYLTFDYNLLNLQARGTESVKWEKRIIENSERSSWNALTTASTPTEAMKKAAAFQNLSSVGSVESVASLIPEQQEERLELIRALLPSFSDLPPALPPTAPVDVHDLQETLEKLKLKIRTDNDEWDPQKKPAEQELREARQALLQVIDRLKAMPEGEAQAALVHFQQALLRDFQDKWNLLRNNLKPSGPISFADIPPKLKTRFISRDGTKFLIQIYPKHNIREREPLEEFITQLRQVDPDVTGSPVIGYESINAMKAGYVEGAMYAFLAILLVTYFTVRRVGDTVLAVLPLALGIIWTAGLMKLCGLQFNLANLVAVPLIIGIGVENGIHIVHRFREAGESGPELVAGSTGQAVALFSLTTMVGFGSLMVARYYGIFSMGLLLTVAVGSVLVASLGVLPLLLTRPAVQESDDILTELVERKEKRMQEHVRRRSARRH